MGAAQLACAKAVTSTRLDGMVNERFARETTNIFLSTQDGRHPGVVGFRLRLHERGSCTRCCRWRNRRRRAHQWRAPHRPASMADSSEYELLPLLRCAILLSTFGQGWKWWLCAASPPAWQGSAARLLVYDATDDGVATLPSKTDTHLMVNSCFGQRQLHEMWRMVGMGVDPRTTSSTCAWRQQPTPDLAAAVGLALSILWQAALALRSLKAAVLGPWEWTRGPQDAHQMARCLERDINGWGWTQGPHKPGDFAVT